MINKMMLRILSNVVVLWGIYLLMEHLGVLEIITQIVICILTVVAAYKMLFS